LVSPPRPAVNSSNSCEHPGTLAKSSDELQSDPGGAASTSLSIGLSSIGCVTPSADRVVTEATQFGMLPLRPAVKGRLGAITSTSEAALRSCHHWTVLPLRPAVNGSDLLIAQAVGSCEYILDATCSGCALSTLLIVGVSPITSILRSAGCVVPQAAHCGILPLRPAVKPSFETQTSPSGFAITTWCFATSALVDCVWPLAGQAGVPPKTGCAHRTVLPRRPAVKLAFGRPASD